MSLRDRRFSSTAEGEVKSHKSIQIFQNILLALRPIDWHHRKSEIVVKDLFDLKRFDRFDFPFGRRAKPSRRRRLNIVHLGNLSKN